MPDSTPACRNDGTVVVVVGRRGGKGMRGYPSFLLRLLPGDVHAAHPGGWRARQRPAAGTCRSISGRRGEGTLHVNPVPVDEQLVESPDTVPHRGSCHVEKRPVGRQPEVVTCFRPFLEMEIGDGRKLGRAGVRGPPCTGTRGPALIPTRW